MYRSGSLVDVESFQLLPSLVTITGASPNPFLPWIDDGVQGRDAERATSTLSPNADAEARVYRPNADGKCCGALVLNDNDGISNLSAGVHAWNWDGQGEGAYAGDLPKGNYFVRITATDLGRREELSKPHKVTIAERIGRTRRSRRTASGCTTRVRSRRTGGAGTASSRRTRRTGTCGSRA